jgi:hypothetical protein
VEMDRGPTPASALLALASSEVALASAWLGLALVWPGLAGQQWEPARSCRWALLRRRRDNNWGLKGISLDAVNCPRRGALSPVSSQGVKVAPWLGAAMASAALKAEAQTALVGKPEETVLRPRGQEEARIRPSEVQVLPLEAVEVLPSSGQEEAPMASMASVALEEGPSRRSRPYSMRRLLWRA